jgi:hypothetical protein
MTDKITLGSVASFQNDSTAVAQYNANNTTLTSAMDNTLSRDGTQPNSMGSNLDMNSFQILNLPSPSTGASPLRLQDYNTLLSGGTITVNGLPTGGTTGQILDKNSNTNYDTAWVTNAPLVSNISGLGTGVATFLATPSTANLAAAVTGETGSGALVFGTSPTITTATLTTPVLSSFTNGAGTVTTPNLTGTLLSTAGQTTVFGAVANSNPTGTSSTTGVMMGLGSGYTFTPKFSTRFVVCIQGEAANTTTNIVQVTLRASTGSAPTNGAALTGSVLLSQYLIAPTANTGYPMNIMGLVTGASPGTTYWVDLSLAVTTSGTGSFLNPFFVAYEI